MKSACVGVLSIINMECF